MFYSKKLNDAKTRYTTTEHELLSIVETLELLCEILLGQKMKVHTDHINVTKDCFDTEYIMRWHILIEEFLVPSSSI